MGYLGKSGRLAAAVAAVSLRGAAGAATSVFAGGSRSGSEARACRHGVTTPTIAPLLVQQQLSCGATKTVARVTPSASGRFALSIPTPADAQAAIYRLATKVRGSTKSGKLFPTFSLPEPVNLSS